MVWWGGFCCLLVFLSAGLAALYGEDVLGPTLRGEEAPSFCVEAPLCNNDQRTVVGDLMCRLWPMPLDPTSAAYRRYAVRRLRTQVSKTVTGQYVVEPVIRDVEQKLLHLHHPLVLHFAGDNGVGKTHLAESISLALGQRCGNEECSIGDSTLLLSGAGYDGLTLGEFRQSIVPRVAQHAKVYPHNGVVIINELTSLEPEKVHLLLPLLGRSSYFPEYPDVDISRLLVILTTDFGHEGRTQGKSLSEMRAFVNEEFRELYSAQSTSYIRTFPFLPISLETAADIVRMTVRDAGCRYHPPLHLSVEESAVQWLVEKSKPLLSVENGRIVAQETYMTIGPLLAEQSELERSTFDLSRECRVALVANGALELQCP